MNNERSVYDPRDWVASNGGPLIVLPLEIAHHWRGISPPPGVAASEGWIWGQPDGPVCDFDRACQVDDYVGMVDVGPGVGLVLGDDPMATTFLPSGDGGILLRWGYAEGVNEFWQAVDRAKGLRRNNLYKLSLESLPGSAIKGS